MASFDLSVMNEVLSYVERGVTSKESFLLLKLSEIEEAERESFARGERGVRVVVSSWEDAELREGTGPWPLMTSRCYPESAPYDDAVWHQEYRWSWEFKKYESRYYWAPDTYKTPTSTSVSKEELMEEIIGILGVNACCRSYMFLPNDPPRLGFRPKNSALELVFVQRYKLEWEEMILVSKAWDVRWNLPVQSVWYPC
ncbi:uncharacterized protein LOC122509704 [Leptopilina heterotoma]|uniref:uncharacterized protein LOC122500419 n=1 Tax=Leptopilina heterotoma TaxID=63436 RepID=UPI001CA97331|nr:uncharacterized protein LOC122500419 [Leptopilina heterotoma]XP_043479871.1 uncharacterized protein LOC122509706 [Leptopilina heterotoma]XP_043479873.1 uncharacterized protein LOC122509704 [Leptopilina heterotoma]